MAVITYPLLTVVDDSGVIVPLADVSFVSVTDASNTVICNTTVNSTWVTLRQAGANVAVDYDAEVHGEGWITLAVSNTGSTITNWNAAPSFYLAKDSSRIMTALPNDDVPTAVMNTAFEGSWTLSDFCRLAAAVLIGNSTGGGVHFASPVDGSTPRVSATVDGSSNRTVTTADPS